MLRSVVSMQPAVQAQYRALALSTRDQLARALTGAAICGELGLRLGWTAALPVWVLLGAAGVLLADIDWRTRQLPGAIANPCLLATAAWIGTASVVTADWGGLLRAAAGWAAGGALFGLVWLVSPSSLGYGDVRLAALLGMSLSWLDAAAPSPGLFLALVLAAATGLLLRATHRLDRSQPIPLGPFLLAGAVAAAVLHPT